MSENDYKRFEMKMNPRDIATQNEILRGIVGSTAHGLAISGQDDRDEMAVFIEPPENVCGLSPCDHYIYRDRPDGVRSQPGDLDLTMYSLRKFCRLAAKGNPSVLLLLWLPEFLVQTEIGTALVGMRDAFISKESGKRFLGYLVAQKQKLKGERAHTVNRPELVAKYGYDCYSDDTEFLTSQGWKIYDEIADGEAVATVHPLTRNIEFQAPVERIAKSYSGEMVHVRHRYSDCLVTPNHRMWVSPVNRGPCGRYGSGYRVEMARWGFKPASEVLTCDHLHVHVGVKNDREEYPIDDVMLKVIGAYVSEGCVAKRRKNGNASVLSFTQNAGGNLEAALKDIDRTYPLRMYTYPPRFPRTKEAKIYTLADKELAVKVVQECGEGSFCKRLPKWAFMLSTRQANLLLNTLLAGDGTYVTITKYSIYYTVSKQLAGDIQVLALLAGYRSNVWGPYSNGMYQVLINDRGVFQAISARNNIKVLPVEPRRVVCFTVPNETLVTRRNGRVAIHGNTKFAAHALRLSYEGIELLTEGQVTLPIPEPRLSVLRGIRLGEVNFAEALALIDQAEADLRRVLDTCEREADLERIDEFMVWAHQRHWKDQFRLVWRKVFGV